MKIDLLDAVKDRTVKDVVHHIVDNKVDGNKINGEKIDEYIEERLIMNITYYKCKVNDYQLISLKKEIKKDVENIMGLFDLAEIDDTDSYNEAFKEWSDKASLDVEKIDEQIENSKPRKKSFIERFKEKLSYMDNKDNLYTLYVRKKVKIDFIFGVVAGIILCIGGFIWWITSALM